MLTDTDREAAASAVKQYLNSPAAHDLYWSAEYGRGHDNAINLAIVDAVLSAVPTRHRTASTAALTAEIQRLRELLGDVSLFVELVRIRARREGDTEQQEEAETALAEIAALSTPSEVSEPVADESGGEGVRAWPDIGPDPMKGERPADRYAASRDALRAAYVRQQPCVPNQTALVWRWHLGAVLEMATRLQAIQQRDATTPNPTNGDAVREALARIMREKAPAYHDCVDNGEEQCAWCDGFAALNHGGTQG